ncbi:MAG TPA: hypothetical protein VIF09_08645, partial [Polyangiaceae bacterium]
MARRYLHPLLLLGASASVLGALAMSCGNGDSPLPAMDPNGSLFVTPCEYIFPLGTGDAGPSSVTFVVQGNTQSGLGADSVPISVQIEACNQAELFVPVGSQGSSCFGSQGLLPPATAPEEAWGGVQLSAPDAGGCTFRSPQELSCTLSADGVASFEV